MMELFWQNHNSTVCHKRQYMSAVFYHNEEQKKIAEETMKEHQKKIGRPIVTKILPAKTFYDAEDYHQKYMLRKRHSLLSSLGLSDKELIKSHVAARLNGYVGGFGSREAFEEEYKTLGISEEQANHIKSHL